MGNLNEEMNTDVNTDVNADVNSEADEKADKVVEKKDKDNKKKKNSTVIAIVAAVAFLAVAVGLLMIIHNSKIKSAINAVIGNEITVEKYVEKYADKEVERDVVKLTEKKEDKPVVQYAKPDKGDLIAHIKIKGYGKITVRFFPEQAPLAVENFVTHAKEGYYDGLTFHRIIDDFMIQGGDPDGVGTGGDSIWKNEKGEYVPFEDEYSKYLIPIRGALCMANSGTSTNGSQFFIVQNKEYMITDLMNLRNMGLDRGLVDYYKENGGACWLYQKHTVFGQVIEGLDVLDKVAGVKANSQGVPEEDVIIESIELDIY